jgi:hypothetical protein
MAELVDGGCRQIADSCRLSTSNVSSPGMLSVVVSRLPCRPLPHVRRPALAGVEFQINYTHNKPQPLTAWRHQAVGDWIVF